MAPRIDVLLFAEDPGAANYVARLPWALKEEGLESVLLATGPAIAYLQARSVPFTPLSGDEEAASLLARWSPRLLAVGTSENPRTLGLRLVDAAQARGLPSIGVVDAFPNASFRFRGTGVASLEHAPDGVIVPDPATAEAYIALGLEAGRVKVCGHPHWDHVRAMAGRLARENRCDLRARLLPGCAADQTALVFASEISTGLEPSQFRSSGDYTLAGNGRSQGRTEIVLDEFLEAAARLEPRPYLVLRLHPKQLEEDLADYLGVFDQVSSGGSPLELMHAADAVVGMSSMLLQEAVLLGRPTLSILPREVEKAWLPGIATGETPCATRKVEVLDALRRLVDGPRMPMPSAVAFSGGESDSAGKAAEFLADLLKSRMG